MSITSIQSDVNIGCTPGKQFKFLTEDSKDAARTCELVFCSFLVRSQICSNSAPPVELSLASLLGGDVFPKSICGFCCLALHLGHNWGTLQTLTTTGDLCNVLLCFKILFWNWKFL